MSNYVDTITVGGTDYPVNIPNGVKFRNPTSITPETNPVIRKNDLAQSLSSNPDVPPSSNAVKTVTDALSSDLASIGDLEVLHSDASGGAITLSKAYTNYKFLILKFMTNSEVKYQLIPTSDITAGRLIMENVYGSSTSGLITKDQMFQYLAMCEVQFTDTTHATQVLQYINANWVLKCAAIWGVK